MKVILVLSIVAICFPFAFANEAVKELGLHPVTEVIVNQEIAKLVTALTPFQAHIKNAVRADTEDDLLTCSLCGTLIPAVRRIAIDLKLHISLIKFIAVQVCTILHLAPRDSICTPIINSYAEQMIEIVLYPPPNVPNNGTQICGILAEDCANKYPEIAKWTVDVKGGKPPRADRLPASPDTTPALKFIQFTDIHMDLDYVPFMRTECGAGMPICCRADEGGPPAGERAAGIFGDFNCALPEAAYKAMLVDAKERHPDAKYVFLTGDYIHSGVWLYNVTENERHIARVINLTLEVFKDTNTKIFPITGNHEANVVNMYVPPTLWKNNDTNQTTREGFDLFWLYNTTITPINTTYPQLISEEELNRFMKWGYYTAKPEEGLRFIFLNTNLCMGENYWLAYGDYANDTGKQLEWLEKVLEKAEEDGDAVYIIGHVEVGSTIKQWSGVFNQILSRFDGIIRGMFYGHSHRPQYRVHFLNGTSDPAHPVSVISGSALTDGMNPVYSVFSVDGVRPEKTWGLMRHELIALKLAESNDAREAKFEVLLDSLQGFGMTEGINGESALGLAKKIVCDQELMDLYLKFHFKGDDTNPHNPCSIQDMKCKMDILSDFAATNSNSSIGWEELQNFIRFTDCPTAGGEKIAISGLLWIATISLLRFL